MKLPDEMQAKLDEHMKQVSRLENIYEVLGIYFHLNEAHEYARCGEQVFKQGKGEAGRNQVQPVSAGEAAKRFCDCHEGMDRERKSRLDQPNADIERVALEKEQWHALHKLRDKLAHSPHEPLATEVWDFVTKDVPPMLPILRRVVSHLTPQQVRESPEVIRDRALEALDTELRSKMGIPLAQGEAIFLNSKLRG